MRTRALLATHDEHGVADLARRLLEAGFELVATGTAGRAVAVAGLPVLPVELATRQPSLLGGRIGPGHHSILAGICVDRGSERELAALARVGMTAYDVVVGRLPRGLSELGDEDLGDLRGGDTPVVAALLHAALVRPEQVVVLVEPEDYALVPACLGPGEEALALRRTLAARAAAHVQEYHEIIADVLGEPDAEPGFDAGAGATRTAVLEVGADGVQVGLVPLRGAGRHGLWRVFDDSTAAIAVQASMRVVAGHVPSLEQRLDLDIILEALQDLPEHSSAALATGGHLCAVASAPDSAMRAVLRAIGADPFAAKGGALGFNGRIDATLARALEDFDPARGLGLILAHAFDDEAIDRLGGHAERSLLQVPGSAAGSVSAHVRPTRFGVFIEPAPSADLDLMNAKIVTGTAPKAELLAGAEIAFRTTRHCPSACVVLADGYGTLAICAGQAHVSDAVQVAAAKARRANRACVAAVDRGLSDAEFLGSLGKARVELLVVPASTSSPAVVAAADAAGIAIIEVAQGWRTLR